MRTPECGTSPRAHERSGGEADGLVLRQPAQVVLHGRACGKFLAQKISQKNWAARAVHKS